MRTRDYIKKCCTFINNTLYDKTSKVWIETWVKGMPIPPFISFLAHHEITEVYSYQDCWKTKKSIVACCGFSKKEKRWYGWTHRGIRCFGIGDSYLGSKQAKTLEDCRKLALYAVKALD